MSEHPEKLDLTSQDISEEKLQQLKQVVPEAFTENGYIDFDKLKTTLGEHVDEQEERFGLQWPGKRDCFRVIQEPAKGTLQPAPDESEDWDNTENLFIEGDNLEVLKLLQKSYYGKVKMIYIDPPYNTGNEFIYPDDYKENLNTYLAYTGQLNEEGYKFSTNTETEGRYHSNWLNMMYPRLFMARNLLKNDGVIFISIDDHEVANLRLMCNEIFGEENFYTQLIIRSNKRGHTYKQISKTHEYILIYTKTPETEFNEIEKEGDKEDLNYEDNIGKFNIRELRNRNPKFGKHNRPNLYFPIYLNDEAKDKDGFMPISLQKSKDYDSVVYPLNAKNEESCWRWGKSKVENAIGADTLNSDVVAKEKKNGNIGIFEKYRKTTYKPKSIWLDKEVIYEQGTIELGKLNLGGIYEFPKPIYLLENLIKIGANNNDIILDFFAGSCTTSHATFEFNKLNNSNNKFIEVGAYVIPS